MYPTLDGRKLCVELWEFQRERAARESAEAERDELREFVRTRYLETRTGSGVCKPREHGPVTDAQFAEAFAAYRAEKGKVAK